MEFLVEKRLYKSDLSLQITKMSGEVADIDDKKIHKLTIICDKKRQKEGKKIHRTGRDWFWKLWSSKSKRSRD